VHGKKGYGPLAVDTTVDQVKESDFDGLVIPGGFAPDKLRRSETVLDLVRRLRHGREAHRLHLPRWLGADLGQDREGSRATSVGAIRDDMVNAGVDWVDGAAVVDGNLISARTRPIWAVDEGSDRRPRRRPMRRAAPGTNMWRPSGQSEIQRRVERCLAAGTGGRRLGADPAAEDPWDVRVRRGDDLVMTVQTLRRPRVPLQQRLDPSHRESDEIGIV